MNLTFHTIPKLSCLVYTLYDSCYKLYNYIIVDGRITVELQKSRKIIINKRGQDCSSDTQFVTTEEKLLNTFDFESLQFY